ncbi:hypothetical protein AURDEDRAFT_117423 [Auricularia subglabra TFB-10046 SS5]|uniref:DUF1746 domain-containing protein n=1 Tax=Auricularia subglabra (strain TFB-10046 / SS5) TaxID=717982 RepID=J0CX42_AURST|nr:hypothetical protein AURDEDRAFT_117423 [Auricularia subglabra TFB-10046 SS5]
MHRHAGQRKHIVSELSVVGYELLVFSFLQHPSVFDLATRAIAQYAASRPSRLAPDRQLGIWVLSVLFCHLRAYYVLLFPVAANNTGLILDFVGSDRVPSRLLLLVVNVLVLALQLVQLCITHELSTQPNTLADRGILDPDPDSDLVLHLRFRNTVDRIAHPPAPPPPLELPPPTSAAQRQHQQNAITNAIRAALVRQLAEHAR